MSENIAVQLSALEGMDTEDLLVEWDKHFTHSPRRKRKEYLVAEIAYHIQKKRYGGLAKTVRNKLKRLAFRDQSTMMPKHRLSAGTYLERDWNGRRYSVMVTDGGFEFEGKHYTSLSTIAREITGCVWSGPLFFGLKMDTRRDAKAA